MKTKYALLALVFCLLLTGCKGQSASSTAALKKEIQLKKYSYRAADNQMELLASASITDSFEYVGGYNRVHSSFLMQYLQIGILDL